MRQEYIPVNDVEVAIHIPEGRQAKSMMILRAGGEAASFRVEMDTHWATIPHLHIAEVVHLVLAG